MVDKKYVYCTAFIKGPGLTWVEFKKNRLAFSIVCTVHVREYQPIPISSVHQKHKRKPRNIRENLMPAVQSSDLFVLLKISKCQLNGPLALCHLSWEKDTHTHYHDTKNTDTQTVIFLHVTLQQDSVLQNQACLQPCYVHISEYLYLINLVLGTPSIILFFCWPYGNLHKFSQRVISCNVNECTKCRALITAAETLNNMPF